MKKSITQVFAATLALWLALQAPAVAADAAPELAPDAPQRHVVVRGDTLWSIAERFLKEPWRWPELWRLNREQIANPHLIHPGDVVYLDESSGAPRLRLGRQVTATGVDAPGAAVAEAERVERAVPRIRVEAERQPIPTIDPRVIEPFLNRPLIVDEGGLARHPRVVATQDGRVHLGRGDLAYVRGVNDESVRDWHVYRSARPLLDPQTRKPIAWEARYVGDVRLERAGDPGTFRVLRAVEEIGVGDRLMPAERTETPRYAPRPPQAAVSARVVSVYRGLRQAGRDGVVAISAGSADGLEPGHVLTIGERQRVVRDREAGEQIELPGQTIGHLLVFRIFDHISYGLIMRSSRDVSVGDLVGKP